MDAFEAFHPDRMASRILGMGDMLTLIEKAEAVYDAESATKAQEKMLKGKFTLDDFLEQMKQLRKMGPIQNIVGMLPGMPKEMRDAQIDERELGRVEAIICSMTPEERAEPAVINGSRRLRIAQGSGTSTQQVNALLKQFKAINQLMKQMGKGPGKKGKRRGGMPGMPDLSELGGLPGMPGMPGMGG
jgi:signal recognition particle subunit SRP54